MNYQKHVLRTILLHKRELETVGTDIHDIVTELKELEQRITIVLRPVTNTYLDLAIEDLTRVVQEIEEYVSKM